MLLILLLIKVLILIVQHTDSYAPCQAAEKAGVLAFGQASNQEAFCPNAHMTAIEDIWGPYYAAKDTSCLRWNLDIRRYLAWL